MAKAYLVSYPTLLLVLYLFALSDNPTVLGFFIVGISRMIISRCHKAQVHVQCLLDSAFYVCNECIRTCDTISSLTWMKDGQDDTRNASKAQEIPCTT